MRLVQGFRSSNPHLHSCDIHKLRLWGKGWELSLQNSCRQTGKSVYEALLWPFLPHLLTNAFIWEFRARQGDSPALWEAD